jgi:hypothetical protein
MFCGRTRDLGPGTGTNRFDEDVTEILRVSVSELLEHHSTPLDDGLLGTRFDEERSETR